jgi:hypothetical protein
VNDGIRGYRFSSWDYENVLKVTVIMFIYLREYKKLNYTS